MNEKLEKNATYCGHYKIEFYDMGSRPSREAEFSIYWVVGSPGGYRWRTETRKHYHGSCAGSGKWSEPFKTAEEAFQNGQHTLLALEREQGDLHQYA